MPDAGSIIVQFKGKIYFLPLIVEFYSAAKKLNRTLNWMDSRPVYPLPAGCSVHLLPDF
jgi:hypothetical protein